MFLKKIVISGFKSFADKIVINLDTGITGIVGPNGSGKSNVLDAVRWVMGEQNAKNLRGEKATDIIFAGSEKRKPLGMAEVSLVFDNRDDNGFCPPEYRHEPEISLTRRMYSDGQREYLINKKPCRLKDIVGFFASSGLSGRSYSMIQQGQVERILNAKPEDVREIIEEAAGTMVYKRRKAEAEKKLEQTNLNLSRIEDILAEVDKHLSTLYDQVDKAREYQEQSEKLKVEEVSLFAHNYHHFREQQNKFQNEMENFMASEAEALAGISGHEARHQELQGQMDEADPELQILQESISVIREKIARSESTVKSSMDKIDSGSRRLSDIASELDEEDRNLRVLETQVDSAQRELSGAESVARELNEAIEAFEYEVESTNEAAQVYQGRMEEFEDEIRNLERLTESNKFRTEALEKEIERNKVDSKTETERMSVLLQDVESVRTELEEAEQRAGATKAGLDKEIREKHEREAMVATRYTQIRNANLRRDGLKEKYHESKARFTSLQEITEGATDAAGALAKMKEEEPASTKYFQGMLTDFISYTRDSGELPPKAAAAFERWSERVVVNSLDHFNEMVRIANRLGTGTLPVCILSQCEKIDADAVKNWSENTGAEPLKQYLKIDSRLPEISSVVDRLYLMPSLSLDNDQLNELPRGVIIFTSQGVSFTGNDEFIVGGKNTGGLLSRKTEMENLAVELKSIESQLAGAQGEIDELDYRINEDRQIVADIDAKLQAQNQGVLQVMSALQAVQQIFDRKQELITESQTTIDKLVANLERMTSELATLNQNRASLDKELGNARRELSTIEEESASLLDRKEEIRRMHESKKLELAKSEARAQALRDGYLTNKAQLELLQNKLARRYEERSRLETEVEEAKAYLEQAKGDIESFIADRDKLQSDYASKREENAHILEELRVIDSRLRTLRDQQHAAQRGLNDKNIQLERVKMALAGITEQSVEKYKLDLETYQFDMDPDFNHESKTRAVQRLRSKIESMGAINMMALQEFDEKTTRRDFIIKQRDEVLSSIDLLMAAIMEIEETSVKRFQEIFETINNEFSSLFPILFPTGEGRLELTQPDNPLESGVEIMCRLPGKSIKPMSLFSGGEKSLTAISLIFALLKTKPTPYCFLDEVDAPLDEANVGRYNSILEALSSQFQFIVITHNRRTMEVLDTLYGITMQEPGVSKVVGVDMKVDIPPHLRKAFKDDKTLAAAGGGPASSPASRTARPVEGATAQ
jgi:chromosome segregation protein